MLKFLFKGLTKKLVLAHKFISPLGVRAKYLHLICPLGLRKIMSVMCGLLVVHWDFDWFTGTCFLVYMRYS